MRRSLKPHFVAIGAIFSGFVFVLMVAAGCSRTPEQESDNASGLPLSNHILAPPVDENAVGVDLNGDGIIELEVAPFQDFEESRDRREFGEPLTGSVAAPTSTIDFETPSLGYMSSMVTNPYVDDATGVTFTAESASWSDAVVGLVKNYATSACVNPSDSNQKLATGRGNLIGYSGFPIRATFPAELTPPVTVSVECQMLANARAKLTLHDAAGHVVGMTVQPALPPNGTCGYPGSPRARTLVTAVSEEPVTYVVIDAPYDPVVFVIDNFAFASGTATQFALDIKPGSCPNPLNSNSRGVLPVAILGTDQGDVQDIDLASLLLEGVAPLRTAVEDVATPAPDGDCACTSAGVDGFNDLTLKFRTQDIVAAVGPVASLDAQELTLTGRLLDGTPFELVDCVRFVRGGPESDFVQE